MYLPLSRSSAEPLPQRALPNDALPESTIANSQRTQSAVGSSSLYIKRVAAHSRAAPNISVAAHHCRHDCSAAARSLALLKMVSSSSGPSYLLSRPRRPSCGACCSAMCGAALQQANNVTKRPRPPAGFLVEESPGTGSTGNRRHYPLCWAILQSIIRFRRSRPMSSMGAA